MSASLTAYLSTLFGHEKFSDCSIVFYREHHEEIPGDSTGAAAAVGYGESVEPPSKLQKTGVTGAAVQSSTLTVTLSPAIGDQVQPSQRSEQELQRELVAVNVVPSFCDPLPAHLVLVYGGWPRFQAHVERWKQEKGPDGKPVLRVPLRSADELQDALSALHFIYAGRVASDSSAELLRIRRQAAYLQVEGCVEACDAALLARVKGLAGVVEVHACSQLLPDPAHTEEPGGAQLLQQLRKTCRQQLAQDSGAALPAGSPPLGDLLAWAFGDAPSLLSDPEMRRQMGALPAAAMEALLGSDHLATDDEATVLLMLAEWLAVNTGTAEEVRKRLCRVVRLSHLSSTYLVRILPALPWFSFSSGERHFLQEYVCASEAKRKCMVKTAAGTYDCSSPWYAAAARPPLPPSAAKRRYEWYIKATDLATKLAEVPTGKKLRTYGIFSNGMSRVVSMGFEWQAQLSYPSGDNMTAGMFLMNGLPASLKARIGTKAVVHPGPVRLVVYKWRGDGSREEAWSSKYMDGGYVQVERGLGCNNALPLASPPTEGQQPPTAAPGVPEGLECWAAYLKDGKLHGVLEWSVGSCLP